jgi:3-oxoadipate enol-lactonase
MPERRIRPAVPLNYERRGAGSSVILVGGLGCDLRFWRKFQMSAVSQSHDVIVFDNRGVGGSPQLTGPYTVAEMADDAAFLLSALGVERAHVVGASMGSMIALELAIRHPKVVRSLTVASGTARSDSWMRAKQVLNQKLAALPAGESILRELMARMNLLWMFEPSFFDKPEDVEKVMAGTQQVKQSLMSYRWQSQALHDHDATHGLDSIRCPTLVMVGRRDILTPVRYAEVIAKAIPGAELRVMGAGGHLFMVEKPEVFGHCVLEFLEDVELRESKEVSQDVPFTIPVERGSTSTGLLRRIKGSERWALVCRGLTGSVSRRSSVDELADALDFRGWSSLRFGYRYSLKPVFEAEELRTVGSMVEDTKAAVIALAEEIGRLPDVVIARGLGARLALEALLPFPEVPLVLWAPILWLRAFLELRGRLHEMRRAGHLTIDRTPVGAEFIDALEDPRDVDVQDWVVPKRRHVIVHGEEDHVAPLQLAAEARDVIERAGGRVKVLGVPGRHAQHGTDVRAQIRAIVSNL